ncbi:MAG: hypothetical protein ABIR17_08090 [Pseudolysinimonas sp.]|uniref:hypothetical protein n=1 Tax=Pseudolysinimonas sp. TaxID=2680009 RepID=UPI003266B9B1
MKKKFALGLAGFVAAGALVFGVAAPASAWYLTGFNTYSDCSWSAYGKRLQGATITEGCHLRPYDGKWAYSYEW